MEVLLSVHAIRGFLEALHQAHQVSGGGHALAFQRLVRPVVENLCFPVLGDHPAAAGVFLQVDPEGFGDVQVTGVLVHALLHDRGGLGVHVAALEHVLVGLRVRRGWVGVGLVSLLNGVFVTDQQVIVTVVRLRGVAAHAHRRLIASQLALQRTAPNRHLRLLILVRLVGFIFGHLRSAVYLPDFVALALQLERVCGPVLHHDFVAHVALA